MEFQDGGEFTECLQNLSPAEFESLVADLWSELGWDSNVTQLSADSGIDVVATKESPFFEKQLIQVKRYGPENTVGSPEIQQYASLRHQEDDVDAVVVITSSTFSRQARALADKLNVKLVDGEDLYELFQAEGLFGLLDSYAATSDSAEPSVASSDTSTTSGESVTHPAGSTKPFTSSVSLRWQSGTEARHPQMILRDETLYIGGGDDRLRALECGAGIARWRAELPSSPRCVAANDEAVFAGCKDYHVYAIADHSGEGNWSVRADDIIGSITESDGVVYFRAHGSDRSTVHAVDAESGTKIWTADLDSGTHFGHIAVAGEAVYCTSDNHLAKIEAETGEIRWQIEGDGRLRVPAVCDDVVYVCNYEPYHLHSIDVETGDSNWSYEAAKEIRSSPELLGDTVYFGCQDSHLYAIDRHDGTERWRFATKGPIKSRPVVTESGLYCASSLGAVYAVDSVSGESQGEYRFEGSISSMTAAGRIVYLGAQDGEVSAIEFPE